MHPVSSISSTCGSYRDRIYARYASAFKGRPPAPRLEADFARHARFLDYLFEPLLQEERPAKILDVGCGAGRFLFWAHRRGFSDLRGFDVSSEQVEIARVLGLPAEVASAADYLSSCDRDFDLVVALDVIEHFTKQEGFDFLAGCLACLRPGGCLFLTTPNGAALRPGPVAYGDLTHETIYSPQTIRLALELSGFSRVRVREIVPPPTSLRSRLRRLLWPAVRLAGVMADLVETGSPGAGIYSRVMAVEARRPPERLDGDIER